MYKEVWRHSVFDVLEEGKNVFALDAKESVLHNLRVKVVWEVIALIHLSKKEEGRIVFYYWENEEESEVVE